MDVLVTCKYEEDPIKNEGARVDTTFSPFSDFFHLFGNGTGTSSIGKNSVVLSFPLGKKRCFPLKLGKFHHQSEIGYKTLAPKTNTIKLLQIVNLCYQNFAK